MSLADLPLIVEPEALKEYLGNDEVLVLDLSKESVHHEMHVPGALFLDYGRIVAMRQPVGGLMPEIEQLEAVFSELGIAERWVVCYDDEGGGKAGRLIWTLHALGFKQVSLLNGGLHAWANEGFRLERTLHTPRPAPFKADLDNSVVADAEFIQQRLDDPAIKLLDARGIGEYSGAQRFSARGGHIPGAIHWDWMELMDRNRNMRLRAEQDLLAELERRGVSSEDEVVTYCQTHHRSSLTYVALRHLGLSRVRGYPGSWSDWGNRLDLPVE